MAATITTGLAVGAFDLYAHTMMPGLRNADDRTFVASFQALDRAIMNAWFVVGTVLGASVLTAAAAVTNRSDPVFRGLPRPWARIPWPWSSPSPYTCR